MKTQLILGCKIKENTVETKALQRFEQRKTLEEKDFFAQYGIKNINPTFKQKEVDLQIKKIL